MDKNLQDILAQYGSLDAYLKALSPDVAASESQRLRGEMSQRYFTPGAKVERRGLPEKQQLKTVQNIPAKVAPQSPGMTPGAAIGAPALSPQQQLFEKYKRGFTNASEPQQEQLGKFLNRRGLGFEQQAQLRQQEQILGSDKFAEILQALKQKEQNGQAVKKETR